MDWCPAIGSKANRRQNSAARLPRLEAALRALAVGGLFEQWESGGISIDERGERILRRGSAAGWARAQIPKISTSSRRLLRSRGSRRRIELFRRRIGVDSGGGNAACRVWDRSLITIPSDVPVGAGVAGATYCGWAIRPGIGRALVVG